MPRQSAFKVCFCLFLIFHSITSFAGYETESPGRPNVLVIITDDQGFGDLSLHGNPHLKTPNIDRLGTTGVRFDRFYVSPVCAPTRASLLTGRYNFRTGVIDTFLGRAIMHSDEVTLAEMLRDGGYRTGIFGKWHLGDNYPHRPIDQGFEQALTHKGGGIGQPSDPPGGESYFDPILQQNGRARRKKGYCTDVFTDEAIRFIKQKRTKPFFAWVAFNAPHTPLQVPDKYVAPFKTVSFAKTNSAGGHPLPSPPSAEITAKVYGMVRNIDDNVGRLLSALAAANLATNTIIVFLTDNGPQQVRYNAGMLERKGSVHEGGIRVPFFLSWPGQLRGGLIISNIAAHIDLVPTLLEACKIPVPKNIQIDGRSLWPLITERTSEWPDRTLFFQWHRGEIPELYRACAARTQKYKLVQPLGAQAPLKGSPTFKLFDMQTDPFELHDIASQHPDIRDDLRKQYEKWFQDVSSTRGYQPVRIHLGSPQEDPVILTRQDWRGPKAGWNTNSVGHWEVFIERTGVYDIKLDFPQIRQPGEIRLACAGVQHRKQISASTTQCEFKSVRLPQGPAQLAATVATGTEERGVHYVRVDWRKSP